MFQTGEPRYVVGQRSRIEIWTGGTWIEMLHMKTVTPLVDLTDPADPTLGRIEMRRLPIIPEAEAYPPAPPGNGDPSPGDPESLAAHG